MNEIITVGAQIKWKAGATRPTADYTVLSDVNEAPPIEMSTEAIDVSNISDRITRYKAGRQDPGGAQTITLNHTDAVIAEWDAMITAYENNGGTPTPIWLEYFYPEAINSYFFAIQPKPLGNNGIAQNENDTIPAPCVILDVGGWAAKSTTKP